MPKKKELPRKRKRFVKKVLFLSSLVALVVLIVGGFIFFKYYEKSQQLHEVTELSFKSVAQAKQEDIQLINLKKGLDKNNIAYTSIKRKTDGSLIVNLEKGGEVTFSSQKDIMSQIASLQYILPHLTMEGKLFSQLDLRFEKPVIKLRE